jgi:hypothetical protein
MSRGIRGYGPGKFNTIIDSLIYDMIGNGMGSESCGDVSEVGFYAESILLGPDAVEDVEKAAKGDSKAKDALSPEEADLIKNSYAAVMVENEQGFVTVDYYETKKEFDKDWAEIEDDASPEDEEGVDEDGEEEEEEAETEEAEEEAE